MTAYRIIFAGTPDFAASALKALINSKHEVVAVYTQPDKPAGRGQKLLESPVKCLALENSIEIQQPKDFKDKCVLTNLNAYQADLMVVAAYGILLPRTVLNAPRLGCLNIHASLLPRWRGAAPIQRAIANGDQVSGISIMLMNEGLDTGDVLLTSSIKLENEETGASLHDKLAILGASSLLSTLESFTNLMTQRVPQNHEQASYAHKLNKQEAKINWSLGAKEICARIRAFNSWPVAFSLLNGKTIRIWQATALPESNIQKPNAEPFSAGEILAHKDSSILVVCGDGVVALEMVQMPGKKALRCEDILRGNQATFAIGNHFE